MVLLKAAGVYSVSAAGEGVWERELGDEEGGFGSFSADGGGADDEGAVGEVDDYSVAGKGVEGDMSRGGGGSG